MLKICLFKRPILFVVFTIHGSYKKREFMKSKGLIISLSQECLYCIQEPTFIRNITLENYKGNMYVPIANMITVFAGTAPV